MLLLSASFLLGACSTKGHEEKMKTQKEAEDEFVATLTAADSSAVLTLCTQCMDLLKAKETDKALDMLYSIDDAGIAKPLTIQQREALTKRFQRFPVIRYRLDYLSFSTQGNNDVKYKIEFTPRSDSDTPGSSMYCGYKRTIPLTISGTTSAGLLIIFFMTIPPCRTMIIYNSIV